MSEYTCTFCGADTADHDYEQLARECYPARVRALEAALRDQLAMHSDRPPFCECQACAAARALLRPADGGGA